MDDVGLKSSMSLVMKHGEDARARELKHLKLALATFALQLEAFEMRARNVILLAGGSDKSCPHDTGHRPEKDDVSVRQ
jgi:hypothetical protein